MFSIYSSWFNVEANTFAWKEALSNWVAFLKGSGQISIVVNTSTDDSLKLITEWVEKHRWDNPGNMTAITITAADIPYSDPEFDGKLKALALSHCTERFGILLDCDERIPPFMRSVWRAAALGMERERVDAFMIPVIDLIGDDQHYRCESGILGSKWYLHRVGPDITRGVVRWAYREDGTIDTTKSDTCELIYAANRELVRSAAMFMPNLPHFLTIGSLINGETPFVYHLGWLDYEQRLKQSTFWQPVWSARNGAEVDSEVTLASFQAIQRYFHQLPSWKDAV